MSCEGKRRRECFITDLNAALELCVYMPLCVLADMETERRPFLILERKYLSHEHKLRYQDNKPRQPQVNNELGVLINWPDTFKDYINTTDFIRYRTY